MIQDHQPWCWGPWGVVLSPSGVFSKPWSLEEKLLRVIQGGLDLEILAGNCW